MKAIGIDLGTTNCVVTRLDGGKPVPILVDGQATLPSVVLYHEGRVVTGREALNLELLHPSQTVRSVKRRMGTAHRYSLDERALSPEEISAELLLTLKRGAERALGGPVTDAVITVPAYFDDAQRRATLRAGELAGLNVLRLLNEPTSAALCYEQLGVDGSERPELIVIYDLGGGTFDVSVLEVFQGAREVRATAGNAQLGGDDFDAKLLDLLVDSLGPEQASQVRTDAAALCRLRRAAERVKIELSHDVRTLVQEQFLLAAGGQSLHLEREVTRRELEALIEPFIDSTIELTKRAVADAGLSASELTCICLVGGSTRIPLVRSRLEEAFGVTIHEEVDPDLAVGLGACVQAAMLTGEPTDRVLIDVAAHTLGIRVIGDADEYSDTPPDTFAPVLRRNTVLPALRVDEFYTASDDQQQLDVEVFQGERARVSQNTAVGSFRCPLEPRPHGSPVRIAFSYDLDGVVRVTVSQPGVEGERSVDLEVPDATRQPRAQPSSRDGSPIERRAHALLGRLSGEARGALEQLLEKLRQARADEREAAEEALLDFFLECEPDDDSEASEAHVG